LLTVEWTIITAIDINAETAISRAVKITARQASAGIRFFRLLGAGLFFGAEPVFFPELLAVPALFLTAPGFWGNFSLFFTPLFLSADCGQGQSFLAGM
jgi:hypothetical protein